MSLETALDSLKRGEFVLLFDSAGRENEIDMVVAAKNRAHEPGSQFLRQQPIIRFLRSI